MRDRLLVRQGWRASSFGGCTLRNRWSWARRFTCGVVVVVAIVAAPPVLRAQNFNGEGAAEIRMLRQAAAREAAGDLPGAERILREILVRRPASLSALLALEDLLRMQGRLEELIPPVNRLLELDPTSAIGHQMRVRSYSALNQVEQLKRAAADWIEAVPHLETPYREIARVWMKRGKPGEALRVLVNGRERMDRDDALALELGDVYAMVGELERAVEEWSIAIGPTGDGFMLVRRRLNGLPDGGARILPSLIDALTDGSASLGRRRAAVELAIDAGLARPAEEGARSIADELEGRDRRSFLVEVARRADGARLPALAHWAYGELVAGGDAGEDEQLLALRTRLAELALVLGDTAEARRRYQTLEDAYAMGSPERRRATALRIELSARDDHVEGAARELEAFRRAFPDAPELDVVAAAVAGALLDQDEVQQAERILTGVSGPRSSLVRSRIALRRGDAVAARASLLSAAPELHGAEATEAIKLATLLGRISPAGGRLIGRALARMADDEPREAVQLIEGAAGRLPVGDRAAVLDFAAGVADRFGLVVEAEQIRRTIVTEHAQAPQAAGAMLALARMLGAREDARLEARELLVRMILEYPRSALVPQARRELDRLQGRVPDTSQ